MFRAAAFTAFLSSLLPLSAAAEFLVDIDSNAAKAAVQARTLDDLSIDDTALVYENFCIKGDRLYLPGWTSPASLGMSNYFDNGVILKAVVLLGKKLKISYVDAAQAQSVAKGNMSTPPVLSTENYNKEVREDINRLFSGGAFGTVTCEDEQRQNPLRALTLFELESINGFNGLSGFLKSVLKRD